MDRRRRPGVRFAVNEGATGGTPPPAPTPRHSLASSTQAIATPSPTSTLSTSSSATTRRQMAELDRLKRRIRRDTSDFFAVSNGGNGEADGYSTISYAGDGEWRLEPRPADFQGPKPAPTQSSPFRASAVHLLVAEGGGYSAGDLTVTSSSRPTPRVTVSGRREIHAAGRASTRRFRDDFDQLPPEADATAAAAWLRSDGRVLVLLPGRRPGFEYRPLGVTHFP